MTRDPQLSALTVAGLIRLAHDPSELEVLFRRALVQAAAYQTLLKQNRRESADPLSGLRRQAA